MKIILAPMEGVADFWVRQSLTDVGHYDWCVSEFVRVSGTLLPTRVFYRWCPELKQGARTRSGTPVHIQLLGSDPTCMADNAARAAKLGAPAIDLNFGCPAKTVNRHGGGAVLLDTPEQVYAVVRAVRAAIPDAIPVSAKMRLGNGNGDLALDNAHAIESAGASWLTVHGRTKTQGYTPPAYWDRIGLIRQALSIPVIANGEIWSAADGRRCQQESGCMDLMVGRGAVSDPFLSLRLRYAYERTYGHENGGATKQGPQDWPQVSALLSSFMLDSGHAGTERQRIGRVKQWLNYLRRRWPQAIDAYECVKRMQSYAAIQEFFVAEDRRCS